MYYSHWRILKACLLFRIVSARNGVSCGIISYQRGLYVVCSTSIDNARALECRTDNKRFPRFFFCARSELLNSKPPLDGNLKETCNNHERKQVLKSFLPARLFGFCCGQLLGYRRVTSSTPFIMASRYVLDSHNRFLFYRFLGN